MAWANLELVRSILAHWERGDCGSAEWAHPDIEYVLEGGRTPAARRARVRVLALIRGGGRGKTSGLKVEYEGALLFHVRGAVVTEVVNYTHRQWALAHLGLAPEADAADSP